MLLERIAQAGRRCGHHARWLPAHDPAGRGPRRGARATRARRSTRVLYIQVPEEVLMARLTGRWICRELWRDLPRADQPAAGGGQVRQVRRRAHPARRRPARRRCATRLEHEPRVDRGAGRVLPEAQGKLHAVDGTGEPVGSHRALDRRVSTRCRRSREGVNCPDAGCDCRLEVEGRGRASCARLAASTREVRAILREAVGPASPVANSTRSRKRRDREARWRSRRSSATAPAGGRRTRGRSATR